MKTVILRSTRVLARSKAGIYFIFYQMAQRQRYNLWLKESPSCSLAGIHTREVYMEGTCKVTLPPVNPRTLSCMNTQSHLLCLFLSFTDRTWISSIKHALALPLTPVKYGSCFGRSLLMVINELHTNLAAPEQKGNTASFFDF